MGQDGYNDFTEDHLPLCICLVMPGFCVHGDKTKQKSLLGLKLFYTIMFIWSFLAQKD